MRTIGYCEHCRKVKNVTISSKNLMRKHLTGICDDCAADQERPIGPDPRDRRGSANPPTMRRDHAARHDDATASPHGDTVPPRPDHKPEDPPPQPHSQRPAYPALPVEDSPNRPPFDTDLPLGLPVEVTCDTCGRAETFLVNHDRFTAWRARRMLIQDALAHLSIPDREFVKSRICSACWTAMFGSGPFRA
ncbi:hypothetical protein [Nocardia wallacei]|uniref:hypothetical protein n=1 Tax=Nocardia wallacei TaxID=480035 RepID=UPI0024580A27|nr:hypothetical protein [Nocardia wallacei]